MLGRPAATDGNGRLALTGTIAFPDRGPGPRFDLAIEAANYPVDRALAAADFGVAFGKPKVTEDTNYALTVSVHGGESELSIGLRYDRGVFSDAVAGALASELDAILEAMVEMPERALGDLGLRAALGAER